MHGIRPWDARAAERFAELQALLLGQGTPIGQNDTLIAAHALSLGATLVTNNAKHFGRVPGLSMANWAGSGEGSAG